MGARPFLDLTPVIGSSRLRPTRSQPRALLSVQPATKAIVSLPSEQGRRHGRTTRPSTRPRRSADDPLVEGKLLYRDPRPGQRVPKRRCGRRCRLSNGGIESTSRKADRKASTSPNPTTPLPAGSSRAGPFEVLVFEWVG